VRLKDVARVELGAQLYNVVGKLNGKPSAILGDLSIARLKRAR
jgi:HAE1 family hydrophobic/amphiphilic exporter-1